MPQRFLRPGLTTSECWNKCEWFTQSFYVRLITLVDDHGRYEAHESLLRSHAFPLHENIRSNQITTLCEELAKNDLAIFYIRDGKKYLQLTKWSERVRSESKYPEFIEDSEFCEQMFADASKCSPPKPVASSHKPVAISQPAAVISGLDFPDKFLASEFVEKFAAWVETRMGMGKKPKDWVNLFQEQVKWLQQYQPSVAIEILSQSIRNGWQGLFPPAGKQAVITTQEIGPPKAAIMAYAKEKWGDDQRWQNWFASFYSYWSDPKRNWKKNGRIIDWQVELSEQVSKWRTT